VSRVRKFVRKARDYKLEHFEANDADKKHHFPLIKKQVKELRTHRCALDTDYKFILSSQLLQ
jgi:hypothetical protein